MEGSFNFSPHSPLQLLLHPLAELPQPLPPPAPNGSTVERRQQVLLSVKHLIQQPAEGLGTGTVPSVIGHGVHERRDQRVPAPMAQGV
jgi:hypothetical protein